MHVWLSTPAFTCDLIVGDLTKRVTKACPVLKWSIGKPYKVLLDWCWKKWPGKVNVAEEQVK